LCQCLTRKASKIIERGIRASLDRCLRGSPCRTHVGTGNESIEVNRKNSELHSLSWLGVVIWRSSGTGNWCYPDPTVNWNESVELFGPIWPNFPLNCLAVHSNSQWNLGIKVELPIHWRNEALINSDLDMIMSICGALLGSVK
jgi:hypothetical protein